MPPAPDSAPAALRALFSDPGLARFLAALRRRTELGRLLTGSLSLPDPTAHNVAPSTQLHLHLSRLVALEYVLAHRADHGAGLVYELVYDGGGKDGKRHLAGLIDVAKLRAAHDYDASHPGVKRASSGPRPARFRPSSGACPGREKRRFLL